MGKSGTAYLRYYLIEASNSVRMPNAEYARYYRTKYDEGTKHKQALVLTAHKLVRLADAILRHNQLYLTLPMNSNEKVNKPANTNAQPTKQHHYMQYGSHSPIPCAQELTGSLYYALT